MSGNDGHFRNQMQKSMEKATGQFFCTTCRARKPAEEKVFAFKRSLCKSCLARRKAVDAARAK
jgi:hypothetical protein